MSQRQQTSEGYNSSGNMYRTFNDGSYTYKNTTSEGHNTNYFHNAGTSESFYHNSSKGYHTHTYSDNSVKTTYNGNVTYTPGNNNQY
eukprot:UN01911